MRHVCDHINTFLSPFWMQITRSTFYFFKYNPRYSTDNASDIAEIFISTGFDCNETVLTVNNKLIKT